MFVIFTIFAHSHHFPSVPFYRFSCASQFNENGGAHTRTDCWLLVISSFHFFFFSSSYRHFACTAENFKCEKNILDAFSRVSFLSMKTSKRATIIIQVKRKLRMKYRNCTGNEIRISEFPFILSTGKCWNHTKYNWRTANSKKFDKRRKMIRQQTKWKCVSLRVNIDNSNSDFICHSFCLFAFTISCSFVDTILNSSRQWKIILWLEKRWIKLALIHPPFSPLLVCFYFWVHSINFPYKKKRT